MIEWITNIDKNILLFLQEHLRNGFFNPIMIFITYLGDGGIMWIVASLAMTAFKKTRKAGIMALLALVLGFIVTNLILKNCFERVRPYDQFQDLILLIRKQSDFSFPSGHSCSSFAVSMTWYHYLNKKGIGRFSVILASLIAFSRLYVCVHFPTDVIVGVLVGILASVAICKADDHHVFDKVIAKLPKKNKVSAG